MNPGKIIAALVVLAFINPSTHAQDFVKVEPKNIGLSAERLQRIGSTLEQAVAENEISGAVVLLARHGEIGYLNAIGLSNLEAKSSMRPNTIFRLDSMTKPIVSVGAMILFEEGRFQLSDPVSKYIPEFADVEVLNGETEEWVQPAREITIQDLLRHTSGIVYEGGDTIVGDFYVKAKLGNRSRTLEEVVLRISEFPLAFSPGEGWTYGRSTEVVGHVIERIAGEPLDQFLRDRLLQPLKMVDTGFFVPPDKAKRLARVYRRTETGGLGVFEEKPLEEWLGRPKLLVPGAGMVSTALDYYRFSQMLLNKGELDGVRILSPTTVDLMVRNHLHDEILPTELGGPNWDWMVRGWGFGLGFRVLVDGVIAGSAASHGSYGWFGCRNTFFLIDPTESLIGIFMAQSAPCVYPGVRKFQSLMHQALER